MVLETLNHPVIDIGRLVLEEPQKGKGLPFDPDSDVTGHDWQEMKAMFEGVRQRINSHNQPHHFAEIGSWMKILFPERADELTLSDTDFSTLTHTLEGIRRGYDPTTYSFHCMRLKTLFPQRAAEFNITEDDWKWMEDYYHEEKGKGYWHNVLNLISNMCLVDPRRVTQLGIIDQSLYENLHQEFRKTASSIEDRARLRILFPNKELDPEENWEVLRGHLQFDRDHNEWWQFATMAACMKIMAAREVKVTDQGLEIVMPQPQKPFQEPIPALPVRRKF